jgi:hypothetical protein
MIKNEVLDYEACWVTSVLHLLFVAAPAPSTQPCPPAILQGLQTVAINVLFMKNFSLNLIS